MCWSDWSSRGIGFALSSLVLYEWLRGPRTMAELSAQEEIFPREAVIPFSVEAAAPGGRAVRVRAPPSRSGGGPRRGRMRAHAGRRPLDAEQQGFPRHSEPRARVSARGPTPQQVGPFPVTAPVVGLGLGSAGTPRATGRWTRMNGSRSTVLRGPPHYFEAERTGRGGLAAVVRAENEPCLTALCSCRDRSSPMVPICAQKRNDVDPCLELDPRGRQCVRIGRLSHLEPSGIATDGHELSDRRFAVTHRDGRPTAHLREIRA